MGEIPYLITGPALISFSGGRSSAYMLHQILQAHGGTLPSDVIVAFANTGKEREETLRFVHECGRRWGVRVRWLEWREPSQDEYLVRSFEEVTFETASRDGEPFAALIKKKKMTPNWQARFCTGILKVQVMIDFMTAIWHMPGTYTEAVGLRHDEGTRLIRMYENNEKNGRKCIAPLSKAKVTKADVMAFWRAQDFDLGLKPHEGNCDLCFLKGRGLRMRLIRDVPGIWGWWAQQEIVGKGTFDRRDSVVDLVKETRESPDFFDAEDMEYDAECGLTCAGEAA